MRLRPFCLAMLMCIAIAAMACASASEPVATATPSPVRGEVLAAIATPRTTAAAEPSATVAPVPSPAAQARQPAPLPHGAPPTAPASGDASSVRFWSSGDSTSYFMSVWMTSFLTQRGAVATQPASEYHVGSGLLSPQRFDWPARIAAEMASRDPNVVIFMIGANDAHAGMALDDYARRVGALMDLMQAPGRRVLWVGQPNMGRADLAAAIPAMNDVFAREAASRPWVTYVDVWAATSDANGAYTAWLPDETGALIRARGDDGVHFTHAGGRILALAVLRAYDASP